jgi:hypothetical protein
MNQRDSRKRDFLVKFQAAAAELNAISHWDVESLKFRDSSSSHDYRDLITDLGPMRIVEIQGNYQGKAWKITDADGNSVIIVEHETGLEILYIVGSVASIVSLVPVVVNVWNRMRDHWPPHRGRSGPGGPERRRFDKKGRLIEEPTPPLEAIMLQHLLNQYDSLSERISSLETDVSSLKSNKDSPKPKVVKKKVTRSQVKRSNDA